MSRNNEALTECGLEPGIPKTLSHYRILEKLGEGGMGVVCRVPRQVPWRRQLWANRRPAGL